MREIKFRQWYKNRFHYFGYENGIVQSPCSASLERDPIDQHVGLHDVNNKDAYENDIISFDNGSQQSSIGIIKYGGYWDYAGFGIVTYHPLHGNKAPETWDALNTRWEKQFSIIGNIHENKELLS